MDRIFLLHKSHGCRYIKVAYVCTHICSTCIQHLLHTCMYISVHATLSLVCILHPSCIKCVEKAMLHVLVGLQLSLVCTIVFSQIVEHPCPQKLFVIESYRIKSLVSATSGFLANITIKGFICPQPIDYIDKPSHSVNHSLPQA